MTVTISADDPRSIKALEIAAGASQWLKVRSADGELGFGIPSSCQPGRFYLVTAEQCDCPDSRRHGLTRGRIGEVGAHQPCKHVRAVQFIEELRRAADLARPKRRRLQIVNAAQRYTEIFGGDD